MTKIRTIAMLVIVTLVCVHEAQAQSVRAFEWHRPRVSHGFVGQARVLYSPLQLAAIYFQESSPFGTVTHYGLEKGLIGIFGAQAVLERVSLDDRVAFFSCGAPGRVCEPAATQHSLQLGVGLDTDFRRDGPRVTSAWWDNRWRAFVYSRWLLGESVDRNPNREGGVRNVDAVGANAGLFRTIRVPREGWTNGIPVGHLQLTGMVEYPLHNFDGKNPMVLDEEAGVFRKLYPDDGHWKFQAKEALFGNLNLGLICNGCDIIDVKPMVFLSQFFQRDLHLFDSWLDDWEERFMMNWGSGIYATVTVPRIINIPFTDSAFHGPCTWAFTPGVEWSRPLVNETVGNFADDWRYMRRDFRTFYLFGECRR